MTTSLILWLLLVPLTIALGVILWLSESPQQRAQRWRAAGWTQQRIADRLGCSRTTVRRWVAA